MFCCPNCFGHPWLKQHIVEISSCSGQCDYCGEDDVPLVEVDALADLFHNLLSMYVEAEDFESGEPLFGLIQWHWSVFNEDSLNEDGQVSLLEDIANSDWDDDDGEPMLDGRDLYTPLGGSTHTTHRDRWEEFCWNVRENPDEPLPFDEFFEETLYDFEVLLPAGTALQRARRGYEMNEHGDRIPFGGPAITAPPAERALPGRVNIAGERVVYCADEEKTAVAEVRAPFGYYVTVGTLTLNRKARILDLTERTAAINPFLSQTLKWDVEIESLLDAFADEMSRPMERDDDPTHYAACQKLGGYIRQARFDGIRYPSALAPDGHNVVLFDPGMVDVGNSKLVKITKVDFDYEIDQTPTFHERMKKFAKTFKPDDADD